MGDWARLRAVGYGARTSDVWVFVLCVLTPVAIGAAAIAAALDEPFHGGLMSALVLLASGAVFLDVPFAICYSSDRGWRWGTLFGGVAGALLVVGAWWCIGFGPLDNHRSWVGGALLVGVGVVLMAGSTAYSDPSPSKLDLRRGAFTLSVALLCIVAFAVALLGPWPEPPWARFAFLSVVAAISLRLIAAEWSRVMLITAFLVVLLGVGGVLVQAGYLNLRAEQREQLVVTSRTVDRLRSATDSTRSELLAAADKDVDALRGVLVTYPPSPADTSDAAAATPSTTTGQAIVGDLLTALSSSNPKVEDARQKQRELLVLPVDESLAEWRTAAAAAATAAITSKSAAASYKPNPCPVTIALSRAFALLPDQAVPADDPSTGLAAAAAACPTQTAGGASAPPPVSLPVALDEVKLQLARYRAVVTRAKADQDAAKELELTVAAQSSQTITVLDAVTRGPRAVASPSDTQQPIPLVLGPLGWLLIAAAALVFWGALLRCNARQLTGPVTIKDVTAPGTGEDKTSLKTVFRIAVLQNLPEPGTTPGSVALQPVTDLLDVADTSGVFAKVVKVVTTVTGRTFGYTVDVEVRGLEPQASTADASATSSPTAGGRSQALVRVQDVQTARTLATEVLVGESAEVVVRSAGLWASGYILGRSTRVPSWASWNAETAAGLGASKETDQSLASREMAVRTAPNSGLLLYLLSSSYELEDRPIEALHAVARAVAAHPRYSIAQYRLAAGLAMMSAHHTNAWTQLGSDRRVPIAQLLLDISRRLRLGDKAKDAADVLLRADLHKAEPEKPVSELDATPPSAEILSASFGALSDALLEDLVWRAGFLPFLAASLRRSERDQILAMAIPFGSGRGERRRRVDLADSARWVPPAPVGDERAKKRRDAYFKHARDYHERWQVTYNAACAAARDGRPQDAMGLLEACLTKRDIHQLSAEWVLHDPDLGALRAWPRFTRFAEQIRQGGTDA